MDFKASNFHKKFSLLMNLTGGFFKYNFPIFFSNEFPERVLVALTYKCNSRCIMCNIWKMDTKDELTSKEWKSMFSDPLFSNVKTLDITGGEAVLADDFIGKIKIMMSYMPKLKRITIVSNGFSRVLILKQVESLLKILEPKKIFLDISVSLDGKNEMHSLVRGIPKAFDKVKATIFALKKLSKQNSSLTISVGSLVLHQNINEVENLKKWLEKNDIAYGFQIVGFHDTYVSNLDTEEHTDFNKGDKKKLFKLLANLARPRSWRDLRAYYWNDLLHMYRDGKRRTTPCPFLYDQFAVDSFGKIYNCFSSPAIGSIRDGKTPSELYLSPENIKDRKKMWDTVCKNCNSGCNASEATAKDLKHYLYFRLTKKPFYGFKSLFK